MTELSPTARSCSVVGPVVAALFLAADLLRRRFPLSRWHLLLLTVPSGNDAPAAGGLSFHRNPLSLQQVFQQGWRGGVSKSDRTLAGGRRHDQRGLE